MATIGHVVAARSQSSELEELEDACPFYLQCSYLLRTTALEIGVEIRSIRQSPAQYVGLLVLCLSNSSTVAGLLTKFLKPTSRFRIIGSTVLLIVFIRTTSNVFVWVSAVTTEAFRQPQ